MFFNAKSFSDDQILEKISDLQKKISFMSYSSNGSVDMMNAMLETLQAEYTERRFMENWKATQALASKTIETDPDLQNEKISKKAENPILKKRNEGITRSNKPSIPDKDS